MNDLPAENQTPQRISLGLNGPKTSLLGIGAWQWGDQRIWGYGKGEYTDQDLEESFQASLAAGVNFFDTAELYGRGRSETLLGQFARPVARDQLVIATKFFPFPWRIRQASLRQALERSLKRLGMEKVDLYQVHFPFPPMPVEHWAAGLADVVEAGLTRSVGVSNYNPDQMNRAFDILAKRGVPLASNQVRYSLLDRRPEKSGLLNICKELGITLIAYSPLAQGMLSGKYSSENPPSGVRRRSYARILPQLPPLINTLREIGELHGGKTPSQVSLNWLICKGSLPIPGVKNVRQVKDNLGALGWRLTELEVARLDEVSSKII
jgi:aryl-alcohol dehydrogenase-like predicted oxidoreductase